MPPKRSTSAKPNSSSNKSVSSPLSPSDSGALSSPSASASSTSAALPEARVSSTVAAALARNSTASTTTTSNTTTTSSSEKKKAAGFFDEAERVYDRSTTRMLNDLAGFIVIFVGMIYFTLSGYFLYRETYGISAAAASATGSQ